MGKFDRVVAKGEHLSFSKSESAPCENLNNRDSSVSFHEKDFLHTLNHFPVFYIFDLTTHLQKYPKKFIKLPPLLRFRSRSSFPTVRYRKHDNRLY